MKLTGNTILITGGTSGIGLELARRLHADGNKVVVAGRRAELLDAIVEDTPGIDAIVLDVADPDSIERVRSALAQTHPDLNVLVNNAGIMLKEELLEPSNLRIAEEHVVINLLGAIRMTYAFLPALTERSDAAIVNVSSSLAFVPFPATPTYSATKAALHSFTESLRVQVADSGVQVTEIVPPGVQTDLLDQRNNPHAMPLNDFIDELLGLLRDNPDAPELVVQRAASIRNAQTLGTYDDLLATFSTL